MAVTVSLSRRSACYRISRRILQFIPIPRISAGYMEVLDTDWWTSGFFPATLYSIDTRKQLCPSEVDDVDWVDGEGVEVPS